VLFPIVRLLRIASIVICLIVIGSFVVFAVQQTGSASGHQREALSEQPKTGSGSGSSAHGNEGGLHRALDDTAAALTSPFSGIVSASKSEWGDRAVRLLLALLVYGFGLGFIARTLRVRV
jgi:hypothetical protein